MAKTDNESKAYCVHCLKEIDPNTHMNCAPTFDDLLDLDERADNGNFQQNQTESNVRPQQANNSRELRRDNNSGKRKQDFNPEASLKTPTKVISINRNSTSPRILAAYNTELQRPQITKCGNSGSNRLMAFHDSLALEGKDNTGNFQQNLVESAVQQQQPNNSCELRRQDNSGKINQDFAPETSIKTPTKDTTSNRNSTIIIGNNWKIGTSNPEVKGPKYLEYGNGLPRLEDYEPSAVSCAGNFQSSNLEANPAFPYPAFSNNNEAEQQASGNLRHQQYEFPGVNQQRNEVREENSQLIYGQSIATNVLEPGNISDVVTEFPKPFPQDRIEAFRSAENGPHVYYTNLQKCSAVYGPHPNKMKFCCDTRVENYPVNLKILPSGSQHSADLNHAMRKEITANEEMQLLGQNKHPSTNMVFETETQDGNWVYSKYFDTSTKFPEHIEGERGNVNYLEGCGCLNEASNASHTSAEQKNADEIARRKYAEKHAQKRKAENRAQKKHVEMSAEEKDLRRENGQRSAEPKNVEKSAVQEDAEKSAERENAEMSAAQENIEMNAEWENAERSTEQENAERSTESVNAEKSVVQEDAEKSAEQENVEMNAEWENAERNTEQEKFERSTESVNAEKSVVQEDAEKSAEQENAKMSAEQENAEQENSKVFTGKGYESIHDFIKALKDGKLYKNS